MASDDFNAAALTEREGVDTLMRSSKSEEEWNENCEKVIAANNGDYPAFWHELIIKSRLSLFMAMKFNRMQYD